MTRVRVEVRDEQRLDLALLKQLLGVKGYIKQGDQHQFVAGQGAAANVRLKKVIKSALPVGGSVSR